MNLIPFRTLGGLSPHHRDMESLWDDFLRGESLAECDPTKWMPAVDISENKDALLIKAELPGLDAKDVHITTSGNILTIKGEKKGEEEKKEEHYYCSERFRGSFQRSIKLPGTIQEDKVEATFEKGVLHIKLPKTEKTKKKEIEIKVK